MRTTAIAAVLVLVGCGGDDAPPARMCDRPVGEYLMTFTTVEGDCFFGAEPYIGEVTLTEAAEAREFMPATGRGPIDRAIYNCMGGRSVSDDQCAEALDFVCEHQGNPAEPATERFTWEGELAQAAPVDDGSLSEGEVHILLEYRVGGSDPWMTSCESTFDVVLERMP